MPPELRRRAHQAFTKCKFGPDVAEDMKAAFFAKLVPAVPRLAVEQYDLGCFTSPKYVHKIEVDDVTPVSQACIKLSPE